MYIIRSTFLNTQYPNTHAVPTYSTLLCMHWQFMSKPLQIESGVTLYKMNISDWSSELLYVSIALSGHKTIYYSGTPQCQ